MHFQLSTRWRPAVDRQLRQSSQGLPTFVDLRSGARRQKDQRGDWRHRSEASLRKQFDGGERRRSTVSQGSDTGVFLPAGGLFRDVEIVTEISDH